MASPLRHATGSLRRYRGEYAAHAHDHAQVLFGVDGTLELELDGRAAFVDAACGLVVPAGVAHRFFSGAGQPVRVWVIDTPVRDGLERVRRFVPPPAWRAAALGAQPPLDATAAVAALAGTPRVIARRRLPLEALAAEVDARLHADWRSARLAERCALSVPRFHARLLELTGLTPQAWLRARRLDAAERLLRAGVSLEATALQVGYRTASALAFALRRERGLGARDLRR